MRVYTCVCMYIHTCRSAEWKQLAERVSKLDRDLLAARAESAYCIARERERERQRCAERERYNEYSVRLQELRCAQRCYIVAAQCHI